MAKKAKRGVKPGTKRGRYRKANIPLRIILPKDYNLKVSENEMPFTPKILTLCGHLEDAVVNLETRISNSIAKINSLM